MSFSHRKILSLSFAYPATEVFKHKRDWFWATMFSDSLTNNAPAIFFPFPFPWSLASQMFYTHSVLALKVLSEAWKHLLLLSLKYLKYRALLQTGNIKKEETAGQEGHHDCKMLSSCWKVSGKVHRWKHTGVIQGSLEVRLVCIHSFNWETMLKAHLEREARKTGPEVRQLHLFPSIVLTHNLKFFFWSLSWMLAFQVGIRFQQVQREPALALHTRLPNGLNDLNSEESRVFQGGLTPM